MGIAQGLLFSSNLRLCHRHELSGDHLPSICLLRVDHDTAQSCRITGGRHASEYDRRVTDNSCVKTHEMGIGEHWFVAAGGEQALLVDDVIVRCAANEAVVNDLT